MDEGVALRLPVARALARPLRPQHLTEGHEGLAREDLVEVAQLLRAEPVPYLAKGDRLAREIDRPEQLDKAFLEPRRRRLRELAADQVAEVLDVERAVRVAFDRLRVAEAKLLQGEVDDDRGPFRVLEEQAVHREPLRPVAHREELVEPAPAAAKDERRRHRNLPSRQARHNDLDHLLQQQEIRHEAPRLALREARKDLEARDLRIAPFLGWREHPRIAHLEHRQLDDRSGRDTGRRRGGGGYRRGDQQGRKEEQAGSHRVQGRDVVAAGVAGAVAAGAGGRDSLRPVKRWRASGVGAYFTPWSAKAWAD